MSGMKFRIQCAGCGATFFALDRKARLCQKCVKKRGLKSPSVEARREAAPSPAKGAAARPEPARKKESQPRQAPATRSPKTVELTPELREQVEQLFRGQAADSPAQLDAVVSQISDKTWVSRKAVRHVINKILHPDVVITSEMKGRMIELYRGYVERSERPTGGRRRAIASAMG